MEHLPSFLPSFPHKSRSRKQNIKIKGKFPLALASNFHVNWASSTGLKIRIDEKKTGVCVLLLLFSKKFVRPMWLRNINNCLSLIAFSCCCCSSARLRACVFNFTPNKINSKIWANSIARQRRRRKGKKAID